MISHGAKKDGIFEIANFKAKTFMETMDGQGGSPGLVVMGDDSCLKGCGFKSRHRILDGHFSH